MPEPTKSNWEEKSVGKNIHSVYTHCLECHKWGVNMPLDKICGNCGNSTDTITYYDSETISSLLLQSRLDTIEEIRGEVEKIHTEYCKLKNKELGEKFGLTFGEKCICDEIKKSDVLKLLKK